MAIEQLINRSAALVIWEIVMTFLITFFLAWRLIERYKVNRRLWMSDYLMIGAWVLQIIANICDILAAYSGYGRLDNDPYLTSERRITAERYMFYAMAFCVFSVFVAKLSICSFLMVLSFSKGFRYVLWMSFIVIVTFNGIWGAVNTVGYCWPVAVRWDPHVAGRCWPLHEKLWSMWTQSAANIFIDIIYALSPLVYIRQIRASRRTRWGIQLIFFLAVAGTGISLAKIIVLAHDLHVSKNTLYLNVRGSILSGAEFAITLIVACLPPLRKSFERIFKKVLPDNAGEKEQKLPSFVVPYFSTGGPSAAASSWHSHETSFYEDQEADRNATIETPPPVYHDPRMSPSFFE